MGSVGPAKRGRKAALASRRCEFHESCPPASSVGSPNQPIQRVAGSQMQLALAMKRQEPESILWNPPPTTFVTRPNFIARILSTTCAVFRRAVCSFSTASMALSFPQ